MFILLKFYKENIQDKSLLECFVNVKFVKMLGYYKERLFPG